MAKVKKDVSKSKKLVDSESESEPETEHVKKVTKVDKPNPDAKKVKKAKGDSVVVEEVSKGTEAHDKKSQKQDKVKQKSIVPKKVKVLVSDKKGISIQPPTIRNIVLNVVFNNNSIKAEHELKHNKDNLTEQSNLKNGYESYHNFTSDTRSHISKLRYEFLKHKRYQYERKKLNALISADKEKSKEKQSTELRRLVQDRKQLLRQNPTASLCDLYSSYDPKFYDDFNEENVVNNYVGDKAYKFYKSLINKNKIRLNETGRNRLTYFLEMVISDFIANSIITCITNKKEKLSLANLVGFVHSDQFYLSRIVEQQKAWESAFCGNATEVKKGQKRFIDLERLNPNNKFKFKGQVTDLYHSVIRKLIESCPVINDRTTEELSTTLSNFKSTTEFFELCAQILIELVHKTGNIIKAILKNKKDRTVNDALINVVINTFHISFVLDDKIPTTRKRLSEIGKNHLEAQVVLKQCRLENKTKDPLAKETVSDTTEKKPKSKSKN